MAKLPKVKDAGKTRTRATWAKEISASYNLGVASFNQGIAHFLETGRKLKASQQALSSVEWQKLIDDLPFTLNTAQRLMKIGADSRLENIARVQLLPPAWGVAYELAKLSDAELEEGVASGAVHPAMTRADVKAIVDSGVQHMKEVYRLPDTKAKPKQPAPVIEADEDEDEENEPVATMVTKDVCDPVEYTGICRRILDELRDCLDHVTDEQWPDIISAVGVSEFRQIASELQIICDQHCPAPAETPSEPTTEATPVKGRLH